MGTSKAYKGTPGWSAVTRDTRAWVESHLEPQSDAAELDSGQPKETRRVRVIDNRPSQSDDLLLSRLLRSLASKVFEIFATSEPDVIIIGEGLRANHPKKGRRQSAKLGGFAIALVQGIRIGRAGYVDADSSLAGDACLDLSELASLTPTEQKRRIVDATSGTPALVEEAELRAASANFVSWTFNQETLPSSEELTKKWVTEHLYQVWLTEAGGTLRDGSVDGESTLALELRFLAGIERQISEIDLCVNGDEPSHLEEAIRTLMETLIHISK